MKNALGIAVSVNEKKAIVDVCLSKGVSVKKDHKSLREECARLGYLGKILPFVVLITSEEDNDIKQLERICKWILNVLKNLNGLSIKQPDNPDLKVTLSFYMEALARITLHYQACSEKRIVPEKFLKKARQYAEELLYQSPKSLLAIKAVSYVANALQNIGIYLNDQANDVFNLLNENLSSSSHFLRLHSLSILKTYPQKPYVVNHSDIDFSGDLDEETSFKPSVQTNDDMGKKSSRTSSGSLSGNSNLMETLFEIETLEVNLKKERLITSSISRIEIIGRTGQLPVVYAEAAVNHMFGMMHVKYQPIWKACVRAIVALAAGHDNSVWPAIERQLRVVMEISFFKNVVEMSDSKDSLGNVIENTSITQYHESYLQWDETMGSDARLFQDQIVTAQRQGRVSRHLTTDKITVFEHVWSVLEGVPHLTTKKSRTIVPIFLQFLHHQYFLFHDTDPDAREFDLMSQITEKLGNSGPWEKDLLGRKLLQKKLTAFLKMFAEVKGMQQLYKHKLLLVIFISFLSNPDSDVAKTSLSCIVNFKLAYIAPYQEELKGMLKISQLRETLTKFNLSLEDGTVDKQHRKELFPIVIRILFGRLSARGSGLKSSKDSPAVRRSAILSFLSGLGQMKHEIDYFVYMMVRTFIPESVNMQIVNCGHHDREHVIKMINHVATRDLSDVHIQRQEGFLNLMSDVIKKLGFGVVEFIPVFTELIVTLIELTESLRKDSSMGGNDPKNKEELKIIDANQMEPKPTGKVRSLCFLRLSELCGQFASVYDFTIFKNRIWASLRTALTILPSSVKNAEKPPSLLILLETMTSHPELIPLIVGQDAAVKAIFECINEHSIVKIIDCAINCVDNLLTEGGVFEVNKSKIEEGMDRLGQPLVLKHAELLIGQFTKRLGSCRKNDNDFQYEVGNKLPVMNHLVSRELSILCRISELLVHEKIDSTNRKEEVMTMMESLCQLLIPFLDFGRKVTDWTIHDILGILKSILPRIRKKSALSHLQAFSRLLGPNRSNTGLTSLEVRKKIISCIDVMTEYDDDDLILSLKKVANALKDLSASHSKHIAECNFEKVLPVLNGLGSTSLSEKSWLYYISTDCGVSDNVDNIKALLPLMYYSLHFLYDPDGIVSRGSHKALKVLISTAKSQSTSGDVKSDKWLKFIESSLVPRLIIGLKTRNTATRRSFILLLAEVSNQFTSQASPHFYGDLSRLSNNDPELDFFQNISHIQVHRRSRALARIRKLLSNDSVEDGSKHQSCPFSIQTLTNILLPLAMHPIYDSETKADEGYALESIATIGALSKHLTWGKYQNILWKALMDLPRRESQERYIIAMICAVIDSFHFSEKMKKTNEVDENDDEITTSNGGAIWKQLNTRLIPKIESYLVKESIERNGSKVKSLRAPIALALTKLFQKLPEEMFESKLSQLLKVIGTALANKDSNERDTARQTLSKIAICIDVKYLLDIVRELAVSLAEGYKLHIRAAALHSVLLALSNTYNTPTEVSKEVALSLPFDKCVPAMMDIIQQDVFGQASEMKEAESVNKRVIKEAMGVKSYSTLEIISQMILFRPSLHAVDNKIGASTSYSSIHSLVSPLLQRIRDPEIDTKTIGKVQECLNRIAIGISHNTSANIDEMLPFVYATVSPFIGIDKSKAGGGDDTCIEDSDEEDAIGLEISKTSPKLRRGMKPQTAGKKSARQVFEWAPSQLKGAKCIRSAHDMKMKDKVNLRKVQDGVNAPKLTGTSRYDALKSNSRDFNDPATSSAVSFALRLLYSNLKKAKLNGKEMMADPFIEILTHCVRYSKDTSAILLSLKSLHMLLRLELPSMKIFKKVLSSQTLQILATTSSNTNDEMTQSCFKTLSLLITCHLKEVNISMNNDTSNSTTTLQHTNKNKVPLSDNQMQVLISILQAAIIDTEQQNATFSVIKAITATKYISPEFYDLTDSILNMTVQSQQKSVRQHAATIFMQYLIEYPMGKQKIAQHLKQMVLNVKYDFEDGRLSAMELLYGVIQKLPIPLLEEFVHVFFLPLVLQLVNDNSKVCREKASNCILTLLKRLSNKLLQSVYEYALRWSAGQGDESQQLRRTSVQLFGIFIDARLDFMKKGSRAEQVVSYISDCLDDEIGSTDHTNVLLGKEWEMCYFCLQTTEKIGKCIPSLIQQEIHLWENVIKCLVHPHPWIRFISSRIVCTHFAREDPMEYADMNGKNSASILVKIPGSLFEIARNLCFQLNSEEEAHTEDISTMAIKNLSWVIRIMNSHPSLCYKSSTDDELAEDQVDVDEEDDDEYLATKTNDLKPVTWLMKRLSNIAKKRGILRREAIFKCFAAFASSCDVELISSHLHLMLEPLNRVLSENEDKTERSFNKRKPANSNVSSVCDLPKDVMQLLEDVCGTEVFMDALALVKSSARQKREARKQDLAAEAIRNPEAAAQRKLAKQEQNKKRRKRKVEEKKASRGVFTKKPRHIV